MRPVAAHRTVHSPLLLLSSPVCRCQSVRRLVVCAVQLELNELSFGFDRCFGLGADRSLSFVVVRHKQSNNSVICAAAVLVRLIRLCNTNSTLTLSTCTVQSQLPTSSHHCCNPTLALGHQQTLSCHPLLAAATSVRNRPPRIACHLQIACRGNATLDSSAAPRTVGGRTRPLLTDICCLDLLALLRLTRSQYGRRLNAPVSFTGLVPALDVTALHRAVHQTAAVTPALAHLTVYCHAGRGRLISGGAQGAERGEAEQQ